MLVPRRPLEWPKPRIEYEHELNYDKEAAWLRQKLQETGGCVYLSAGEADPELYSQLEDDLRRAKDDRDTDISVVAGPVIRIPEKNGLEKKQKAREYLSPIMRLAKERTIMLYPLEKRLSNTFGLFMNTNTGSVQEPCAPGEKPGEARRIYNWWIELAEYEYLAQNAIYFKSPVTKDFTKHFFFLTDGEIAELKEWAKSEGKDVMKIGLESCREFWTEYKAGQA